MAHRLLRDPEADGWESSEFPIVCEDCLGPNPYVRMQKARPRMMHGAMVKMPCFRTSFDVPWRPVLILFSQMGFVSVLRKWRDAPVRPRAGKVRDGVPHLRQAVHCFPLAPWH